MNKIRQEKFDAYSAAGDKLTKYLADTNSTHNFVGTDFAMSAPKNGEVYFGVNLTVEDDEDESFTADFDTVEQFVSFVDFVVAGDLTLDEAGFSSFYRMIIAIDDSGATIN